MTDLLEDDDWTETRDAVTPRMDLVGGSANGISKFLLMKTDGTNLISPDVVEQLLAKADKPMAEIVKDVGDDDSLLEAPDADAEGDADMDPSSPAWESADANTAVAALSDLARLRAVVGMLADREGIEAVTNDPDDAENVWSLEDAQCAIDYAMSLIAPYAIDEQAEVDLSDVTKSVMKSLALNRDNMTTIESLSPIVKRGAKLSSASMGKISDARAAVAAATAKLDDLIASMPAPTDTEGDPTEKAPVGGANPTAEPQGGTPVAKRITPADVAKSIKKMNGEPVTDTAAIVPVAEVTKEAQIETEVVKAGDPQILVYDQNGNVVGSVDPKNLTTFQNSATPGEDTPADDGSDAAPADDAAPAADASDPVDQTTIPGTDTIQSPPDDDVTKATGTVADALKEILSPFTEKFERHAELEKSVADLQERLTEVLKMPDDRKSPVLNGSIGKAGAVPRDAEKESFAEIQKQIEEISDPVQKAALQNTLAYDAIKQRFQR